MAEHWLSISEYARRYSLSDMTVRRRIKNGRIHAVLKDGKYFIPSNETRHVSHSAQEEDSYERPRHQNQKTHPSQLEQSHLYRSQPQMNNGVHQVQNSQIQLIKGQANHQQNYVPPTPSTDHQQKRPITEHIERQISGLEQKIDQLVQLFGQVESICAAKFEAKTKSLESDLKFKEREVKELLQQNEDLKLLLKFVERKVPGIGKEKAPRI